MRQLPDFFLLLLLFICTQVFALPEDSQQKIHITADSTIYNYKTGINVFEGHVKVDQGTTHITSNRLTTHANSQHQIQEAVAYGDKGERAHYWTLPKPDDKEFHAYADVIKFHPVTSNVTLEGNVIVSQGENSFQGELILYNMNQQTVTVPPSKNGRAVLVYNPDK